MDKQKKQELIVTIVIIIFVSIMAGSKLNLGVVNTVITTVLFLALYLLINFLITKFLTPFYNLKKESKQTAPVGRSKQKKH